jgi:membrane protease YdiL (CAAX protease family)
MKHPILWFCVIAYAISWTFTVLVRVSLVFGFVALFGPAVAAYVVTRATTGAAGVRAWREKLGMWRVGLVWYGVAMLIPELVSGLGAVTSVALGAPSDIGHLPVDGLKLALFVSVVGEELGWRGWLLPRLLERRQPLAASLWVGVIWAGWHLPTFVLPGTTQSHFPLPAYVIYVCALSVLFTWLYFKTRGSTFYATVLHGCVNTFLIWNFAASAVMRDWLTTLCYAAAAAVVVRFTGGSLGGRQASMNPR